MARAAGHPERAGLPRHRPLGALNTPTWINLILKRRCAMVGLDPEESHGLREGCLTRAARQGVALPEAMQQSQHGSVQEAAGCYNEAERAQGRAARLGV